MPRSYPLVAKVDFSLRPHARLDAGETEEMLRQRNLDSRLIRTPLDEHHPTKALNSFNPFKSLGPDDSMMTER